MYIPGARECFAQLHEKPFRGGSTCAPTATVSVPPQPQLVVPMAPPATSKSQEPRQQVVPLALPAPPPRPQQRPASQNLAVQPVAPLAPPIPCYGMANPPRMLPASSRYRVLNRPAVPLALPSTWPPVVQQPQLPRPQLSTLERGMVSSQVVPMAPPTSVTDPGPEPPSFPLAGMDAHFHLDCLYSRMKRFNHYDVEASLWRKPKGVACHIVCCVLCYCFPEIWPDVNYLNNQLPSSANRFTVGWHPTRVYDYFDLAKGGRLQAEFLEHLAFLKCITLGKVGLDYLQKDPFWMGQQGEMLRALVEKAKAHDKPLLLHIRDQEGETAMFEECL